MLRFPPPYRVYVGLQQMGYLKPESIRETIAQGMRFCGGSRDLEQIAMASPNIVIRPDITAADSKVARYAYTHPEIVSSVVDECLKLRSSSKIKIIGRSHHPLPTARMFRRATGQSSAFRSKGYYELEHRFPGRVAISPDDEEPLARYLLSKGNSITKAERREILASGEYAGTELSRATNEIHAHPALAAAAFTVYCPKIKSNVWLGGMSAAIALGASDQRYPGWILSNHHLSDMLEVCNPNLIVSDGIVAAAGGNHLTQRGHELGVVLVSNNALAHDWVVASILNLDPYKVAHLRMALQRGWGPSAFGQIELGGAGAEGVAALSQKTKFWDLGMLPIQELPEKYEQENPGMRFPIEILSGPPHESVGAHGVLLDWLYCAYDQPAKRALISRWPRVSLGVGAYESMPRNTLVFLVGDRAITRLEKWTSSSRHLATLFGVQIHSVQLKSGRRHIVFSVTDSMPETAPTYQSLFLLFTMGSLGWMTLPLVRAGWVYDRVVSFWPRLWRSRRSTKDSRVVMTSRLPNNRWWINSPQESSEASGGIDVGSGFAST